MILKADKVQLKRGQLVKMLQKKKCSFTEHVIQQFGLLDSYLETEFQNETEARERRRMCAHTYNSYVSECGSGLGLLNLLGLVYLSAG
jgi:hypothetical protein